MWNYDEKDLLAEVGEGNYLKVSGCYIAVIKEIVEKVTQNGYKQINITFDVNGAETTIYHTYTGKDGVLDFKVRHLNHLLFLTQSTKIKEVAALKGKTIGVFLKAKLSENKKYINFDLEGFFHPTTKQTSKEAKEGNKELKVYNKMKEIYWNEKPLETVHEKSTQEQITSQVEKAKVGFDIPEDDDEFPF